MNDVVLTIPYAAKEQASTLIMKAARGVKVDVTPNQFSATYTVIITSPTLIQLKETLNAIEIQ